VFSIASDTFIRKDTFGSPQLPSTLHSFFPLLTVTPAVCSTWCLEGGNGKARAYFCSLHALYCVFSSHAVFGIKKKG